jgi:DNA polymerase III subunit beta
MTKPLNASEIAALGAIAVADRSPFSLAVALATAAVDRKNAIPILSNLLLVGRGGELEIVGTDLDMEIRCRVACPADERLATTVPAHMLRDILGKAKASDMVSIEAVSDASCKLDLGGLLFTLNALPATDFPDVDAGNLTTSFQVTADDLVAMFDKTRFAISTEETRYYLNGVYLHHHDSTGKLRAVTTDGHRLGMMAIDAPGGSKGMPGAIVPRKTVLYMLNALKLIARSSKAPLPEIKVELSQSRLRFTVGTVTVTSKLIDGTFPDYERVVPRDNSRAARMSVKALDSAVEQVSLISQEKGRAVRFTFSSGKCLLQVVNPDAGRAETTIDSAYAAEPLEIGFNSSYVRDFCAEITGDDVAFEFKDSGSPTIVRDPADTRWTGVLMPTRV